MRFPQLAFLLLPSLTWACVALDDPDLSSDEQSLLGEVAHNPFGNTACDADLLPMLEEGIQHGRIAALTPAFEQCVATAFTNGIAVQYATAGPYMACRGVDNTTQDPFRFASAQVQLAEALKAARSETTIASGCQDVEGIAWAPLGPPSDGIERFNWSLPHLRRLRALVTPANTVAGNPYAEIGADTWHEGMHGRGYFHGTNNVSDAKLACGYPSTSQYEPYRHSMPAIARGCVFHVLKHSASLCGDQTACGPDALPLIDAFGSNTCSCVQDLHGAGALGELGFARGRLRPVERVTDGTPIGWWYYRATDRVLPVGDVDGDQKQDLLIRNADAVGIVSHRVGRELALTALAPWGSWAGSWLLSAGDEFTRVGDMNGDGRAEILVRSGWGVGILTLDVNGNLTSLAHVQFGGWAGSWRLGAGDELRLVADFDGNGRQDLIVRSGWGVGVLSLSGSSLVAIAWAQHGTSAGGWWLTAADRLEATGDFNGDGRADLVIRSTWGLGLLTLDAWNRFGVLAAGGNGTWLHGWRLAASDTLLGVGDLDGDGRKEFVIRSAWGINFIGLGAGNAWRVVGGNAFGDLFGSWRFGSGDQILAFADISGDGRDDVVLRSAWGLALVTQAGFGLSSLALSPNETLLEGWKLRATDRVLGTANLDGGPGHELIVTQ